MYYVPFLSGRFEKVGWVSCSAVTDHAHLRNGPSLYSSIAVEPCRWKHVAGSWGEGPSPWGVKKRNWCKGNESGDVDI